MAGSPAQASASRPGLHPTAWVVLVLIVLLLAGMVAVVRRARTHSTPVAVGIPVRAIRTVRPTAPSSIVLTPTSVVASSFLDRSGEHHPPQHAFDHNPRTAWNDSVSDTHSGQWIEAAFDGARRIDSVTLATGWNATSRHGRDLFVANVHLRRVRLVFDGGITRDANVAEGQRELTVDAHGVTSSRVRIVALDVWPGYQYNDLCISDVSVLGR